MTKGLAMDFVRQGRKEMAITSIWPASAIESAATEHTKALSQSDRKDLRKPVSCPDGLIGIADRRRLFLPTPFSQYLERLHKV